MQKVDFFIVGAPKCGTSAMHVYLNQHPNIFMPKEKELYFHDTDLNFKRPRITESEYKAHFANAKKELIGEATATYLRSEKAAQNIYKANPKAKIIIMLRDPVEMIYSLHNELVSNGDEVIQDFDEALKAVKRVPGENLSTQLYCPLECLDYVDMGMYANQVKRYYEAFDSDQIKVISFEYFKDHTREVYEGVLEFLGVALESDLTFDRVNPNSATKNKAFQRFMRDIPESVKSIARLAIPFKKHRKKLFDKMNEMNQTIEVRKPMNPETRKRLRAIYKNDIAELAEIAGWHFKHYSD